MIILFVDKFSRVPIYEQLITGMEREITAGMLKNGDPLPSIRELSASLGVNPNTIQKAYVELSRRGVISSAPGSGYYVTPTAQKEILRTKQKQLAELEMTFRELAAAGIRREQVEAFLDRVYENVPEKEEEKS